MYRYELHMHSKEGSGCSFFSIHDMIKRRKELGYTGAVITNHFYHGYTCVDRNQSWHDFVMQYASAYYEGQKTAKELDFDLLFGIEEGYGDGKEILVYGLEPEIIADNDFLKDATLQQWCEFVHKNGGFVAYAHPFRARDYIPDPNAMPDMEIVDGYEVHNYCNRPEDNDKAEKLLSPSGKVKIAGSDTHDTYASDGDGIVLNKRVATTKELADKLLKNDFQLYIGEKD